MTDLSAGIVPLLKSLLRIPRKDLGDLKLTWSADNREEVATARRMFDEQRKKGWIAYTVKRNGEKGSVIREFDPDAEMIIMSEPLVGG